MNEIKIYDLNEFTGDIKNSEDIQKYIQESNKLYQDKIKSKLKFRGKTIFFGTHRLNNGLYQQFVHISGFLEKDDNFFIPRPCRNERYILNCNNCINRSIVNRINAEDRYFCFYRCSYMVYIINIFKLINVGNLQDIEICEEKKFMNKKMKEKRYIHIRYVKGDIYYYILLEDVSDKGYYSFICGFPIFNQRVRNEKDKLFSKLKKEEV